MAIRQRLKQRRGGKQEHGRCPAAGYFLAAVTRYDGKAFVTTAAMNAAPGITFLWTTTFPLSESGVALAHRRSSRRQATRR